MNRLWCFAASLFCVLVALIAQADEKQKPAHVRELIVGTWEHPDASDNHWQFGKDGGHTISIAVDVINTKISGTYRIRDDGTLEVMTAKPVGGRPGKSRTCRVKVSKEKLTFVSENGPEESLRRAQ